MSKLEENLMILVNVIEIRLEWLQKDRPDSEEIYGLDFCLSKLRPLVSDINEPPHGGQVRCTA